MKVKLLFTIVIVLVVATVVGCSSKQTPPPPPTAHTEYYMEATCGTGLGQHTNLYYSLSEPVCETSQSGFTCTLPGPSFHLEFLSYIVVDNQTIISTNGYCEISHRKQPIDWVSEPVDNTTNTMSINQISIDQFLSLINK